MGIKDFLEFMEKENCKKTQKELVIDIDGMKISQK